MNIEIFCLCKGITVNKFNQLTLIDIFDKKIAEGEPVLLEPFFVIASIRFYKTDVGVHRMKFVARDDAKNVLVSSDEIVSIDSLVEDSTTFCLQNAMPERVSKFGTYWFSIEAGGRQLAKTPLYVLREKV
jgi:hypothetical protein